ncbi:MAG: Asp-tRNA(Asn)/Glu-tRNA(Gln) amidotransferase GatCAB subunit A [Chloroflexi bacterium]|nr:MAG: Asp-tRNA(Asn)/Glu-tRNA(Gln) amidotransferase GatCAB subunit A [Chloroflexota bacterium]
MSQAAIIDRLRLNLKAADLAADLAVDEQMVEEIVDKGFLQVPTLFAALLQNQPVDLVPDYLAEWGATGGTTNPPVGNDGVAHLTNTIAAVYTEIQRGAISPVELTEQALTRLAERDPVLNMFQLVLAERARAAAHRAEEEIRQGHYRGPLHGIPVAIKDLLHLAGTPTTAGSIIRAGEVVPENAAVVDKLEEAGAIIIGKTRMSEFAYAPASINPHYGPTRNPHALDRDTGGSSSGSGAAVADGVVFAALGSDTGGSIRIPAAHCGLAGLKATFGCISLHGAINLAWSLDHVGPLTRSVADAALVFDALAGPDPHDPRTRTAPPVPVAELISRAPDVRGLRIGVLRNDGSGAALATDDALAAWRTGLRALEQAGAELVEIDLPDFRAMWVLGAALLAQEAIAYHLPTMRTRLNDYGEFMRMRILAACAYEPGALVRAQQLRGVFRQRANAIFDQVDLLSTPSMPAAAPPLDTPSPTYMTMPFNLLGWPTLTVPVGKNAEGLPLGLQLAGKPWDEATLFRAGLALEQALR